jgi:hypothetical protein
MGGLVIRVDLLRGGGSRGVKGCEDSICGVGDSIEVGVVELLVSIGSAVEEEIESGTGEVMGAFMLTFVSTVVEGIESIGGMKNSQLVCDCVFV